MMSNAKDERGLDIQVEERQAEGKKSLEEEIKHVTHLGMKAREAHLALLALEEKYKDDLAIFNSNSFDSSDLAGFLHHMHGMTLTEASGLSQKEWGTYLVEGRNEQGQIVLGTADFGYTQEVDGVKKFIPLDVSSAAKQHLFKLDHAKKVLDAAIEYQQKVDEKWEVDLGDYQAGFDNDEAVKRGAEVYLELMKIRYESCKKEAEQAIDAEIHGIKSQRDAAYQHLDAAGYLAISQASREAKGAYERALEDFALAHAVDRSPVNAKKPGKITKEIFDDYIKSQFTDELAYDMQVELPHVQIVTMLVNIAKDELPGVDRKELTEKLSQEVVREMEATAEVVGDMDTTAEVVGEMDATAEVAEKVSATAELAKDVDPTAEVAEKVSATAELAKDVDPTAKVAEKVSATAELAKDVDATAEVAEKVSATAELAKDVNTTAEVVGKVDAKTKEVKDLLGAYIKKVDELRKNGKGFGFFREVIGEARNREANYRLAEELLKRLNANDTLEAVFADMTPEKIEELRYKLATEGENPIQGFNKGLFGDHGINSKDLKAALEIAFEATGNKEEATSQQVHSF